MQVFCDSSLFSEDPCLGKVGCWNLGSEGKLIPLDSFAMPAKKRKEPTKIEKNER